MEPCARGFISVLFVGLFGLTSSIGLQLSLKISKTQALETCLHAYTYLVLGKY